MSVRRVAARRGINPKDKIDRSAVIGLDPFTVPVAIAASGRVLEITVCISTLGDRVSWSGWVYLPLGDLPVPKRLGVRL
jgi:hypothetical protein